MKQVQRQGVRWLPEDPYHRLSDTIAFHLQQRAELGLIGSFKEKQEPMNELCPSR